MWSIACLSLSSLTFQKASFPLAYFPSLTSELFLVIYIGNRVLQFQTFDDQLNLFLKDTQILTSAFMLQLTII
jgi:hypothetical protein